MGISNFTIAKAVSHAKWHGEGVVSAMEWLYDRGVMDDLNYHEKIQVEKRVESFWAKDFSIKYVQSMDNV